MPTATVKYFSHLRTEVHHVESGHRLITDAPKDNNGNGESFSPTDLTAVSLASCMLTMMGIAADQNDILFETARAEVEKIMASAPRRIHKLVIAIEVGNTNYSEKEKELLERAAIHCPVAKSLHPDIIQDVSFEYKTR